MSDKPQAPADIVRSDILPNGTTAVWVKDADGHLWRWNGGVWTRHTV